MHPKIADLIRDLAREFILQESLKSAEQPFIPRYIARDADGVWNMYPAKPSCEVSSMNIWSLQDPDNYWQVQDVRLEVLNIEWTESLVNLNKE